MRGRMLAVGFAVAIGASAGLCRGDDSTPEGIVDRAIRAHGGEERLAGLTGCVMRSRTAFTDGVTSDSEVTVQLPGRYRSSSTLSSGVKSRASVMVIDGDQGWSKTGDLTLPYPAAFLGSFKKNSLPYTGPRDILRLRARQKNPACHFTATGETSVGGRPAVGLLMKLDGGSQQTWYFAKDTGLLLKEETRTASFEGEDTVTATLYEDYQDFDGFPLARKATSERDGKTYSTRELIDFKVATPDPGAFAKP